MQPIHNEKLTLAAAKFAAVSMSDDLSRDVNNYVRPLYVGINPQCERYKIIRLVEKLKLLTLNAQTTRDLNTFIEKVRCDRFNRRSDPDFYRTIKVAVEQICFLLTKVNTAKRNEVLNYLAKQVVECGPGVFTTLNEIAYELANPTGLFAWLVTMRKGIVDTLAAKHIVQAQVASCYSVHVHLLFYQWAAIYGLNLPNAANYQAHEDPHHAGTKTNQYTQMSFYDEFIKQYQGAEILEVILGKYRDLLEPFMDKDYLNQQGVIGNLTKIVEPFIRNKIFKLEDIFVIDEETYEISLPTDFMQRLSYYTRALLEHEQVIKYTQISHPEMQVMNLYNERLLVTPRRLQSDARKSEAKNLAIELRKIAQLPKNIIGTKLRAKAIVYQVSLRITAINSTHSLIRRAIIYFFGIWRTRLEQSLVDYRHKLEIEYGSGVRSCSEFEQSVIVKTLNTHTHKSASILQRMATNPHYMLNRILKRLEADQVLQPSMLRFRLHTRSLVLNNHLLTTEQVKLILQLSPRIITRPFLFRLNSANTLLDKGKVDTLNLISKFGGPAKAHSFLFATDEDLKPFALTRDALEQNTKSWLSGEKSDLLKFIIRKFSPEQLVLLLATPSEVIGDTDAIMIGDFAKGNLAVTHKLIMLASINCLQQCTNSFLKSKSFTELSADALNKETVLQLMGSHKQSKNSTWMLPESIFGLARHSAETVVLPPPAPELLPSNDIAETIGSLQAIRDKSAQKIKEKYSNISGLNLWRRFRATTRIEHHQSVIDYCDLTIATIRRS